MEVLRTERLLVRELTGDDVDGLLELFADRQAMWAFHQAGQRQLSRPRYRAER